MNSQICDLINKYIHTGHLTDEIITKCGLICRIKYIKSNYDCFIFSCLYGNMKIVKLMIKRGVREYNNGFYSACEGGHMKIVKLMIKRGANDWNYGLSIACEFGHKDIAELMINPSSMGVFVKDKNNGANDLNWGLSSACGGGHMELVKFMLEQGANDLNDGLSEACDNGHKKIAKLLINPSKVAKITKGTVKVANHCAWCNNTKHKFKT